MVAGFFYLSFMADFAHLYHLPYPPLPGAFICSLEWRNYFHKRSFAPMDFLKMVDKPLLKSQSFDS